MQLFYVAIARRYRLLKMATFGQKGLAVRLFMLGLIGL